jgi:hypothetical protein
MGSFRGCTPRSFGTSAPSARCPMQGEIRTNGISGNVPIEEVMAGQVFTGRRTSLRAGSASQVFRRSGTASRDKDAGHRPKGSATVGHAFKTRLPHKSSSSVQRHRTSLLDRTILLDRRGRDRCHQRTDPPPASKSRSVGSGPSPAAASSGQGPKAQPRVVLIAGVAHNLLLITRDAQLA